MWPHDCTVSQIPARKPWRRRGRGSDGRLRHPYSHMHSFLVHTVLIWGLGKKSFLVAFLCFSDCFWNVKQSLLCSLCGLTSVFLTSKSRVGGWRCVGVYLNTRKLPEKPQVFFTCLFSFSCFEIGPLTGLDLAKSPKVNGEQAPEICLSFCFPNS